MSPALTGPLLAEITSLDQIINFTLAALPLTAVGFDFPFSTAFLAFVFFFPFLAHANTTISLRWISPVLVTPAFHHWHHALELEAINTNYGAVFSFWNRAFGSWHLPARMPAAYGITATMPETWLGQLIQPFRPRNNPPGVRSLVGLLMRRQPVRIARPRLARRVGVPAGVAAVVAAAVTFSLIPDRLPVRPAAAAGALAAARPPARIVAASPAPGGPIPGPPAPPSPAQTGARAAAPLGQAPRPSAGPVQGAAAAAPQAHSRTQAIPAFPDGCPTPPAPPRTAARRYTVRAGDSLSSIAQHCLGTATAWRALYDLNRGRRQADGDHLSTPNHIRSGWSLLLTSTSTSTSAPTTAHPGRGAPTAGPRRHTPIRRHHPSAAPASASHHAPAHPVSAHPLRDRRGTAHAAAAGGHTDAVWTRIAACESSGDWHINTGNGYYGGLQFAPSTWTSFGGGQLAPRADLATPSQQIQIAQRVQAVQGWHAWPICSARTNGSSTGR